MHLATTRSAVDTHVPKFSLPIRLHLQEFRRSSFACRVRGWEPSSPAAMDSSIIAVAEAACSLMPWIARSRMSLSRRARDGP